MRLKMGLSEEAASKIIKGVQNQRLIGNLQVAKSQGALTLEKVLDMADSGVDVDSFISADMRLQMFSKEVCPRTGHRVIRGLQNGIKRFKTIVKPKMSSSPKRIRACPAAGSEGPPPFLDTSLKQQQLVAPFKRSRQLWCNSLSASLALLCLIDRHAWLYVHVDLARVESLRRLLPAVVTPPPPRC